MSKYLVTGGAGFIGSNLVDELINQGNEVVIIDDLSTGKKEYINSKAKFYELDISSSDINGVFELEKPDYVFHLAAQMDVRKSVEDPVFDNKVNVIGSLNIFENSRKLNVKKIVFFSTGGAIYGDIIEPASENTMPAPDSPYASHKFTAEKHLEMYNKIHGLNYAILRPANVYGPRQYKGGEGAVVAVFTHNALNNNESIVYGDGKQTRDYVYVGDIVEACLKAINSEINDTFNIGAGVKTDVLELIKVIEKVTGKTKKYRHEDARPGEVRDSVLSSEKIKEKLNWEIQVGLEEGIKRTIEWVKNNS